MQLQAWVTAGTSGSLQCLFEDCENPASDLAISLTVSVIGQAYVLAK